MPKFTEEVLDKEPKTDSIADAMRRILALVPWTQSAVVSIFVEGREPQHELVARVRVPAVEVRVGATTAWASVQAPGRR